MPRGGLRKGSVADPSVDIKPGDNAFYLTSALRVQELGRKKVDLFSLAAVQERISEYFKIMVEVDKKPTITGLCMALGYDRKTIYNVMRDLPTNKGSSLYTHTSSGIPADVRETLNRSVELMTNLWEDYMQNGKINPAAGIFLGKNFYGMRDEVEHVVTAQNSPVDEYSAEDIASRYITDESSSETPPNKR